MKEIFSAAIAICIFCTASISQTRTTAAPPGPSQSARPNEVQSTATAVSEDYVIGEEDVLEIRVWKEPDFEAKGVVRPDGKIGVPGLGDVQASGLTPKQLAERIIQGLGKFFAEPPVVTVLVPEVRSKMVHIGGNIAKTGQFALGGPLTVMELITRAGGLTNFAKTREIQIIRKTDAVTTRFYFNYDSYLEGKYQQNIPLHAGDVVIVP